MEIDNPNKKDYIIYPGETFPFKKDLLSQGNFYLQTKTQPSTRENPIEHRLISKSLFKILSSSIENNTISIKPTSNFYSPENEDVIIGTITSKSSEFYRVDIGTYANAYLNTTDFEGATKKNKPNLKIGDVVFSKVEKTNKFDCPTLTCLSNESNKNWSSGEALFGKLEGGHMYKFSLKLVGIYMNFLDILVSRLNDAVDFEFKLGHNGYAWINSQSVMNILKIKEIFNRWATILYREIFKSGYESVERKYSSSLPDEIEIMINEAFGSGIV